MCIKRSSVDIEYYSSSELSGSDRSVLSGSDRLLLAGSVPVWVVPGWYTLAPGFSTHVFSNSYRVPSGRVARSSFCTMKRPRSPCLTPWYPWHCLARCWNRCMMRPCMVGLNSDGAPRKNRAGCPCHFLKPLGSGASNITFVTGRNMSSQVCGTTKPGRDALCFLFFGACLPASTTGAMAVESLFVRDFLFLRDCFPVDSPSEDCRSLYSSNVMQLGSSSSISGLSSSQSLAGDQLFPLTAGGRASKVRSCWRDFGVWT